MREHWHRASPLWIFASVGDPSSVEACSLEPPPPFCSSATICEEHVSDKRDPYPHEVAANITCYRGGCEDKSRWPYHEMEEYFRRSEKVALRCDPSAGPPCPISASYESVRGIRHYVQKWRQDNATRRVVRVRAWPLHEIFYNFEHGGVAEVVVFGASIVQLVKLHRLLSEASPRKVLWIPGIPNVTSIDELVARHPNSILRSHSGNHLGEGQSHECADLDGCPDKFSHKLPCPVFPLNTTSASDGGQSSLETTINYYYDYKKCVKQYKELFIQQIKAGMLEINFDFRLRHAFISSNPDDDMVVTVEGARPDRYLSTSIPKVWRVKKVHISPQMQGVAVQDGDYTSALEEVMTNNSGCTNRTKPYCWCHEKDSGKSRSKVPDKVFRCDYSGLQKGPRCCEMKVVGGRLDIALFNLDGKFLSI